MGKIKVGIIFGGFSKEREISFAGGRTVYDNLNKSIFEPLPIFVDSFGNFILLNWEFVYKGSIRDFYPPVEFLPPSPNEFQIYAESLGTLSFNEQEQLISKIGKRISLQDFEMDFAFLCLHGPFGEDGKIQGLLECFNIPYSGAGILPSAIGIDKVIQKKMLINSGFNSPDYLAIKREDWFRGNRKKILSEAKKKIKFPLVVKAATQGSTIGVSVVNDEKNFKNAVNKSFFTHEISKKDWEKLNEKQKVELVRRLVDIREGIGIPVRISKSTVVYHPEALLTAIYLHFKFSSKRLLIESLEGENEVLAEGFIYGKEFSCIVIQGENGTPVALPPTEIRKGKEVYDYRSKYLPGLSRKITPMNLPSLQILKIRKECERLFTELSFDVYARIDGFITSKGKIFLNDPNTTSGMMPSSFFFHQAAEIGLNPSQFLTFIIRTSLRQRIISSNNNGKFEKLLNTLDEFIRQTQQNVSEKIKVAVLLGGFSSERHISVESGRNIYEKLASSEKYKPIPVFLTGTEKEHKLYHIPVKILLKDNADDIKEKAEKYTLHPALKDIIKKCSSITEKYSSPVVKPKRITYENLSKMADVVFIALHGRPGEDGTVQAQLEKVGLPYNGSGVRSSQTTIDKFTTNEMLRENGFLVPEHLLVSEEKWNNRKGKVVENINRKIKFPLIVKPVDDGCSSAVRKIKTVDELEAYAKLIFRKTEELEENNSKQLNIKPKEEFPRKKNFLVEEFISRKNAKHFLEITGGMLTRFDSDGNLLYEVFEASETLSEGEVLTLEEKFLAGQGQNITPARYAAAQSERQAISEQVKKKFERAARALNVEGYCRIDAFVRVFEQVRCEVIFIEVNSLPGMTPATCIFHQAAINHYKPFDFIDHILDFAFRRNKNLKLQPA